MNWGEKAIQESRGFNWSQSSEWCGQKEKDKGENDVQNASMPGSWVWVDSVLWLLWSKTSIKWNNHST
ncbi:predicted protein [Sclerotinia sclerotiorum 1980 UF-70]|uniref:Uncharacterized protein n=1 Tax=Sclerotinia sclerotiorum (strain ATCC 18683 / 1980 / Ss-1) TaxID=665079 RepID=A7EDP0_SCLS1|nr:predicted protein [Sclerotinia sclerotiorum 1980 UF-70]EDO00956.1 predicted protein [Sclerotinia sclerotiorum 1980 UF-70]